MKKIFRFTLTAALIAGFVGGTIWTLFAKRDDARQQAAQALQSLPPSVEILTLKSRTVEYTLDAVGKAEPSAEAAIIAENSGRITGLYLHEGGRVSRGQVVAEIDTELRRIALDAAESALRQAERTYARLEKLKAENNTTDAELETALYNTEQARAEVASAKRRIADARIIAPISGVVTKRNVEHGSVIQPGQSLAQVTNVATLKVKVPLSEQDVNKVKTGQPVKVSFDAMPGKTITGRISNIAVVSDDAWRFEVEVTVPNAGGLIRSGMSARVQFGGATRKNVVTIPKTALISLAATPSVFVIDGEGKAGIRAVEVGNSLNDNTIEVRSGLHNGDRLVVKGQDNLKEGDHPNF